MIQLYDAGVGDVITIPGHHPPTVTVTGYAHADLGPRGPWLPVAAHSRLSWLAPGWQGTTTLSDAMQVSLVEKAGPDNPLRRQYEADLEAAFAALADTIGEG